MELVNLLNMTVTEVHEAALAAGMPTGDWFESQIESASLNIAPGVVPNSFASA